MKKANKPKVGDKIYVDSHCYISRGSDDVVGGLATVESVEDKYGHVFVSVKEHPNHGYNWEMLSEKQEELKKRFGENVAYPDPDIDTPWLGVGDYYSDSNGESRIYEGPDIW